MSPAATRARMSARAASSCVGSSFIRARATCSSLRLEAASAWPRSTSSRCATRRSCSDCRLASSQLLNDGSTDSSSRKQALGRAVALEQDCVRLAALGAVHHIPQVDLERITVDPGDVLVGVELVEADRLEGFADLVERLPQGRARLGLFRFAPQQTDEPLARLLARIRKRQIAEQRPRLAPVQNDLAVAVANHKVAEGFDSQARPLGQPSIIRHVSI